MNQEVYFIIFNDEFIQWYSASELVQNNQLLSSVLKTTLSNEFVFNKEAEGYTVGYTASDISVSLNKQHVRNRAVLQPRDLVTLKSQNRTCHILFIEDNKDRKCIAVSKSDLSIGRKEDCNIVIPHSAAFERQATLIGTNTSHAQLEVARNSYTYLNSQLCKETTRIESGDVIQIFDSLIIFYDTYILVAGDFRINGFNSVINKIQEESGAYSSLPEFSQNARIYRSIDNSAITIDPPPALSVSPKPPFLLAVGPSLTMTMAMLVSTGVSLGNAINNGFNASFVTSSVMALSMLAGALMWPWLLRKHNEEQDADNRKLRNEKYQAYLDEKNDEIKKIFNSNENIITTYHHPSIERLLTALSGEHIESFLWERNYSDNDFLTLRLGTGVKKSEIPIQISEKHFSLIDDPLTDGPGNIVKQYENYESAPIVTSWKEDKIIGIFGRSSKIETVVNNLLVNTLFLHAPQNVKTVFLFEDTATASKYDCYFDTPHIWSSTKDIRYLSVDKEHTKKILSVIYNTVLIPEGIETGALEEHYVIFCWDKSFVESDTLYQLVQKNPQKYPVTFVFVDRSYSALPKDCTTLIQCKDTFGLYEKNRNDNLLIEFTPDAADRQKLRESIQSLSGLDISQTAVRKTLPKRVSFLDMFRVGNVEQLAINSRWNNSLSHNSLATPIGMIEGGDVLEFDIHEAADGCHGIVAGTTGSGKSEFLQTYILSMMVNYSPDDVNFVLVDFKGGDIATPFKKLPHLSATISNLSGSMLYRAMVSLEAEKIKRQEIFEAKKEELGKDKIDINSYQSLYHAGIIKDPLPHLIIIMDEFAQFKTQYSEYMQKLIDIAQIGRSLGIHLILATQKPAGIVDGQIWSNSRFKFCLKVMEREDSKAVLQRDEAAYIKTPGTGYMQIGYNEKFNLFQSGYCRANYIEQAEYRNIEDITVKQINEDGSVVNEAVDLNVPVSSKVDNQINAVVKELQKASILGQYKKTPLWQPVLPGYVYTDDYYAEEDDLSADHVKMIVGYMDVLREQKQKWYVYDLIDSGNLAVYGTSGSGKTTLVQSLLYQGVCTYTPEQFKYAIIDIDSKNFSAFADTEYETAHVFSSDYAEMERFFDIFEREMTSRKNIFAENGCNTYSEYNSMNPGTLPVIWVALENYVKFFEVADSLQWRLIDLISSGSSLGIYIVITTNSKSGIHYKVAEQISSVISLNMQDADTYRDILGIKPDIVPENIKGRALILYQNDLIEMQIALPVHNPAGNVRAEVMRERLDRYRVKASHDIDEYYEKITIAQPVVNNKAESAAVKVSEQTSVDTDKNYRTTERYAMTAFIGEDAESYDELYVDFNTHRRVFVCSNSEVNYLEIGDQILRELTDYSRWELTGKEGDTFVPTLKEIKAQMLAGKICVILIPDLEQFYEVISNEDLGLFNGFVKNYPDIIYITGMSLKNAAEYRDVEPYLSLCRKSDVTVSIGGAPEQKILNCLHDNFSGISAGVLSRKYNSNQCIALVGSQYAVTSFRGI